MDNIKNKLTNVCSFLSAWDKIDETTKKAVREMGYVRAYLRGGYWHDSSNIVVVHSHHVNKDRWMELLNLSKALTKVFPTLDSLSCFCITNAQYKSSNEYNLFYEGKAADYWIRAITRNGDYNLYIHSIVKEGS